MPLTVSEITTDASMRRLAALLAVLVILLIALAWESRTLKVSSLSADQLRPAKLRVGLPPSCQGVTISCNSGPPTYTRQGDIFVPNVAAMCFPEGDLFFSVKVNPRQYLQYSSCPTIAYLIDKTGRASRVRTLVSSGSHEIDSIAMDAVKARTFKMPQHCFSCRMETRVDVDF